MSSSSSLPERRRLPIVSIDQARKAGTERSEIKGEVNEDKIKACRMLGTSKECQTPLREGDLGERIGCPEPKYTDGVMRQHLVQAEIGPTLLIRPGIGEARVRCERQCRQEQ